MLYTIFVLIFYTYFCFVEINIFIPKQMNAAYSTLAKLANNAPMPHSVLSFFHAYWLNAFSTIIVALQKIRRL